MLCCLQKVHNPKLRNVKKAKRKGRSEKTKFEEYVEMDMQKGADLPEDKKLEMELAKKLKVKGGLLPGLNDHINSLFMDTDSECDSHEVESSLSVDTDSNCESLEEEEIHDDEKNSGKAYDENSLSKKCKKRKSLGQGLGSEPKLKKEKRSLDQGRERDDKDKKRALFGQELDGDEACEAPGGEFSTMEACSVEGALEGNVKYVAPHGRNHAEDNLEYVQIRRRVRGMRNWVFGLKYWNLLVQLTFSVTQLVKLKLLQVF